MATAMKTRICAKPAAPTRGVAARAAASRPLWLPGSTPPKHLDGSMPADYGFDPLNLGVEKKNLEWYKNAEVFHCRLAMTAVAGILIPGALLPGFPQWFNAGAEALKGSPFPYSTLLAIEIFLFGFVEGKRWMDILKPGSQAEEGSFFGFEGAFKGSSAGPPYPGGPFNPMGMGKDGSGNVSRDMQVKEIKNGRLAMVALVGFTAQYSATGKGPLQCLTDHLANPWANNFTTNGISIPIPELVK